MKLTEEQQEKALEKVKKALPNMELRAGVGQQSDFLLSAEDDEGDRVVLVLTFTYEDEFF